MAASAEEVVLPLFDRAWKDVKLKRVSAEPPPNKEVNQTEEWRLEEHSFRAGLW